MTIDEDLNILTDNPYRSARTPVLMDVTLWCQVDSISSNGDVSE
eukprot:CAMPEP_0116043422 /NCGR_PEP_ID=MMETSP0321-20121206/26355_1 /TAXON_ID=163516 /ORGANISM="Leptocylindrus danicus var. danicus, Strain B650" /LENGTH=43 /DNA_ID= /DNA_START= /DNA_END= /DNA_ORIENTATION=